MHGRRRRRHRTTRRDPGGLHVPRAVRRPRHHVRPDVEPRSATTTRRRSSTSARPASTSTRCTDRARQTSRFSMTGTAATRREAPRGVRTARRAQPGRPRAAPPVDLPRNAQGPRARSATPATTRTSSSRSCTCCSSTSTTRSSTASARGSRRSAGDGALRRGTADRALALPVDRRARLPRAIAGDATAARPAAPRRRQRAGRRRAGSSAWRGEPAMPVEFSAAAFRFGHSMVRPDYSAKLEPRAEPSAPRRRAGAHLGGFRRLPDGAGDRLGAVLPRSRPRGRATSSSRLDDRLAGRALQAAAGRHAGARRC